MEFYILFVIVGFIICILAFGNPFDYATGKSKTSKEELDRIKQEEKDQIEYERLNDLKKKKKRKRKRKKRRK